MGHTETPCLYVFAICDGSVGEDLCKTQAAAADRIGFCLQSPACAVLAPPVDSYGPLWKHGAAEREGHSQISRLLPRRVSVPLLSHHGRRKTQRRRASRPALFGLRVRTFALPVSRPGKAVWRRRRKASLGLALSHGEERSCGCGGGTGAFPLDAEAAARCSRGQVEVCGPGLSSSRFIIGTFIRLSLQPGQKSVLWRWLCCDDLCGLSFLQRSSSNQNCGARSSQDMVGRFT